MCSWMFLEHGEGTFQMIPLPLRGSFVLGPTTRLPIQRLRPTARIAPSHHRVGRGPDLEPPLPLDRDPRLRRRLRALRGRSQGPLDPLRGSELV